MPAKHGRLQTLLVSCYMGTIKSSLALQEYHRKQRRVLKNFVKQQCVSCSKKMVNDWAGYCLRGNFCVPCNRKINRNIEHGSKIQKRLMDLGLLQK